jgi:hypothetical protein
MVGFPADIAETHEGVIHVGTIIITGLVKSKM